MLGRTITSAALSAIALSILAVVPAQAQSRNNIIFSDDFESGSLNGWDIHEACCQHSHSIVTAPVRNGLYAYRSLLKKGDPLTKYNLAGRAEIQLDTFPQNSERWVGVSIYFPPEGDKSYTSIFQFPTKPGRGQKWTSPPCQLIMRDDQLSIKRYAKGTTGVGTENETWNLGAVTRGKWMDFVFRIKNSSGGDGRFEAWLNGQQVVQYQGITMLTGARGNFVKLGIYKGRGNQANTDTPVYYDEFRIGDENATYQDVVPSGKPLN